MTERPSGDGLFDAKGRWVPRALIKEVDLVRDELVRELVDRASKASLLLAEFKRQTMADIAAFVDLSAEKYGVSLGGTKGNVTLTSYDGRYRIVRAIADRLIFDERLQVAKELIDACITEWTTGSRDEIRALVEHAFQADKAGKISTERILGLRRLEINSDPWREAMRAISDSVQVASSVAYVRFYERDGEGESYRSISLDLATVPAGGAR
jgi:Protein of unknown function (DUF3164)